MVLSTSPIAHSFFRFPTLQTFHNIKKCEFFLYFVSYIQIQHRRTGAALVQLHGRQQRFEIGRGGRRLLHNAPLFAIHGCGARQNCTRNVFERVISAQINAIRALLDSITVLLCVKRFTWESLWVHLSVPLALCICVLERERKRLLFSYWNYRTNREIVECAPKVRI